MEVDVLKCCECVCVRGGDAVGRYSWTAGLHLLVLTDSHHQKRTSHADACEDGDNRQPPPDTHQLLFPQERQ